MTETLCPTLLDRRVLPLAELLALVLDGQAYRVGDAFAPIDTPDTPALRASALRAAVPRRAIAERATAAWIHGARSSPPVRPQVCLRPPDRGARIPVSVDSRQRRLTAHETTMIGPLAVTTPLRTAADLVLTAAEFSEPDALEVRHLLAIESAAPSALLAFVPRTRRGGAVRVIRRLALVERSPLPVSVPDEAAGVSPR
ncbi:hypothetical protein IT072_11735 [Leifsonia sp. ZF2019]|uniref:hypothetical protein n=1 Tax=Leifsonia sp. ZF2019 TaxID=2781978 RepID=UPI001CBB1255|nr:hypothetical protein [Leifsonia sp. ZF2019]UAJ77963.1 hypothetical protein IT072_11735 [Leifsonia sp. ZF2019]